MSTPVRCPYCEEVAHDRLEEIECLLGRLYFVSDAMRSHEDRTFTAMRELRPDLDISASEFSFMWQRRTEAKS